MISFRGPLHPSRSETFPLDGKVFHLDGIPIMHFDGGHGEPIVFVHGLGANMTHFEHVVGPLHRAGHRTIGLDLPGFGLSGKPHRRYSIRYLTSAVVALLDRLKLDRVTLCGHSLGGLICAEVALRLPERVDRLVLISSAGVAKIPRALKVASVAAMRESVMAPILERYAPRILDLVLEADNDKTRRFREQSLTRPDSRFVLELARVMCSLRKDLVERHLVDDVERLTIPTLVLWGKQDRLLPFKPVPAWAERLVQGELEVIESCGHMPIIERPEIVVDSMRKFLQRTAHRRKRIAVHR